jgi:hypothetical protein
MQIKATSTLVAGIIVAFTVTPVQRELWLVWQFHLARLLRQSFSFF